MLEKCEFWPPTWSPGRETSSPFWHHFRPWGTLGGQNGPKTPPKSHRDTSGPQFQMNFDGFSSFSSVIFMLPMLYGKHIFGFCDTSRVKRVLRLAENVFDPRAPDATWPKCSAHIGWRNEYYFFAIQLGPFLLKNACISASSSNLFGGYPSNFFRFPAPCAT